MSHFKCENKNAKWWTLFDPVPRIAFHGELSFVFPYRFFRFVSLQVQRVDSDGVIEDGCNQFGVDIYGKAFICSTQSTEAFVAEKFADKIKPIEWAKHNETPS